MKKTNNNTMASPIDCRNAFKYPLVSENLDHLLGQVLTIIDASTEGEKNKAIKDLIKDKFSKKHEWFSELSWKELEPEGSGHKLRNYWEDNLIPITVIGNKIYSFRG